MAVVYSDVEEYDPLARDDYGTADCSEVTTRTVSNAFFDGPVDDAGEPGDGKEDKTEEEEQLKTVDQKEDRVKVDEDLGEVKEAEEGVKEQEHVEPKEGDGEEEEEEEEEEIPPKVKEVTFINDVPIYKPNHLLMDEKNHYKCVVYELVGFDDKVGGTYLVTAHDKEMVLRVEKIPGRIIGQELEFLKKLGRCYALAQYQMKEARALRRAYEDENGEGPNFSLDLPEVEDAVQWGSPFDLAVHTKPSLPPSPSSDDEVDEEGTTVSRRPSHADAPPLNTAAPAPMPTVVTTSPDATRPLKVGPVLKILAAIGTYLPENPIDN
ncbi:unnamed protein product, partial [Mesorhabditis spiculigera]